MSLEGRVKTPLLGCGKSECSTYLYLLKSMREAEAEGGRIVCYDCQCPHCPVGVEATL